jgi:hypothetical protein
MASIVTGVVREMMKYYERCLLMTKKDSGKGRNRVILMKMDVLIGGRSNQEGSVDNIIPSMIPI